MIGAASKNAQNWVVPSFVESFAGRDPFLINGQHPQSVRQLSWDMVDRINLPMLLRFEDRNSMAFGVEARVPFVDHELMEFALSLPEDFLIRKGQTKAILREAVNENVPRDVSERRDKIGFQTAESEWLKRNTEKVDAMVRSGIELVPGVFSTDIATIVSNHLLDETNPSSVPWKILSFLNWVKVFDVRV